MNITGIVAEYNPFHKGHVYHIENSRRITKCDGIIAIMSGNFVQRGIPSIMDKWTRTKLALLNGIDLVIELPALYSVSSAEFFAAGAVSLMNNLHVVDNLCFGSECDNIELLELISNILYQEPDKFKNIFKDELASGISFPQARSNSLVKFLKETNNYTVSYKKLNSIISCPNNILAIEYIKSLKKSRSKIKPFSIKRTGQGYNCKDINGTFPSASAIRDFLKSHSGMQKLEGRIPECTYKVLNSMYNSGNDFSFEDSMIPYLKYKCLFSGKSISCLPDISEGLENRILRALNENLTYDSVIMHSKSKRYTYTRISRILCQFFLGFELFDTFKIRREHCPYARILGFNKTGMKILREINKNSSIPIYIKFPRKLNDMLQMDLNSTKAYSLLNKSISYNSDYTRSPVILN